ncbi:MAG: methionine--tRNA ligase subunit beta [archaeon]
MEAVKAKEVLAGKENEKLNVVEKVLEVVSPKLLSFSDWKGVDIRVGLIELVEEIPNKDKLYKLSVDFGVEKRTVISGIKPFYAKSDLEGKKSPFVFNLAPAKIAGFISSAMILGAQTPDGKYKVFFVDSDVLLGTRIE